MRRLILLFVVAIGAFGALVSPAARAVPASSTPVGSPVIAAVGDIACKNPPGNNVHLCQYDDVSNLIAGHGYDAFLALGDEQYEYGRYQDFIQNYDAFFGRQLPITYPVPGNHEYGTAGAAGYFRYFGDVARSADGWYSFDIGSWHVIALNSAICSPFTGAPCGPGTPESAWLKADLADTRTASTHARSRSGITRCSIGRSIRTTRGSSPSTTTVRSRSGSCSNTPAPTWR